jgi:hypothetical protein
MTTQINTNKALEEEKRSREFLSFKIADTLQKFEYHITRIEVHLEDESGRKDGFNEVSCLLEARIEGRKPITITNEAKTMDKAVTGAIDKTKTAMESILGRIKKQ